VPHLTRLPGTDGAVPSSVLSLKRRYYAAARFLLPDG